MIKTLELLRKSLSQKVFRAGKTPKGAARKARRAHLDGRRRATGYLSYCEEGCREPLERVLQAHCGREACAQEWHYRIRERIKSGE